VIIIIERYFYLLVLEADMIKKLRKERRIWEREKEQNSY
jgi:hypothetical protein